MTGYSATPLPRKLGIGEGDRVALLSAPARFERVLGRLPEGVVVRTALARLARRDGLLRDPAGRARASLRRT